MIKYLYQITYSNTLKKNTSVKYYHAFSISSLLEYLKNGKEEYLDLLTSEIKIENQDDSQEFFFLCNSDSTLQLKIKYLNHLDVIDTCIGMKTSIRVGL